jgi:pimeloyl-ACP methyl ester carboxylesterase
MRENMTIYHEIHGKGLPLVLIHGAFGSVATLGDILPALAATRRVIAVDLQAHGRTPDVDRPLRPESMAADIADLLSELDIERADIMGYSLGGSVALQVAIRHPAIVRKLVIVSQVYKRRGWSDETVARMDAMDPAVGEMLKPHFGPQHQDFDALFNRISASIKIDFDHTEGVKGIQAPTLLIYGSADGVRPEFPREFLGLLRDGRLEIIPGATHLTIFTPVIVPAVTAFLDA